jgi:RNA polymerase sigma-54 factor
MMIKEIAEEIGVHPSTVSRAVSNKIRPRRRACSRLRYFFSEAVQGVRRRHAAVNLETQGEEK